MSAYTFDEIHQAIIDAEFDEEEMRDLLKVVKGMSNNTITLEQIKALSAQREAGAIGRAGGLRKLASSVPLIH